MHGLVACGREPLLCPREERDPAPRHDRPDDEPHPRPRSERIGRRRSRRRRGRRRAELAFERRDRAKHVLSIRRVRMFGEVAAIDREGLSLAAAPFERARLVEEQRGRRIESVRGRESSRRLFERAFSIEPGGLGLQRERPPASLVRRGRALRASLGDRAEGEDEAEDRRARSPGASMRH